jgi:hypothetical protein
MIVEFALASMMVASPTLHFVAIVGATLVDVAREPTPLFAIR